MPGDQRSHTKAALQNHEAQLVEALNAATKKYGADDPLVKECLTVLLQFSQGHRKYRYSGEQLRATIALLDRLLGTPAQTPRPNEEASKAVTWNFENAPEIGVEDK